MRERCPVVWVLMTGWGCNQGFMPCSEKTASPALKCPLPQGEAWALHWSVPEDHQVQLRGGFSRVSCHTWPNWTPNQLSNNVSHHNWALSGALPAAKWYFQVFILIPFILGLWSVYVVESSCLLLNGGVFFISAVPAVGSKTCLGRSLWIDGVYFYSRKVYKEAFDSNGRHWEGNAGMACWVSAFR